MGEAFISIKDAQVLNVRTPELICSDMCINLAFLGCFRIIERFQVIFGAWTHINGNWRFGRIILLSYISLELCVVNEATCCLQGVIFKGLNSAQSNCKPVALLLSQGDILFSKVILKNPSG